MSTQDEGRSRQLFEALVRENSGTLMAFLHAATRDHGLAEDLFQQTLMVAWRRLDDFDRERPFGAWLRGIARRLALKHFSTAAGRPAAWTQGEMDRLEHLMGRVQETPGDTFAEKAAAVRRCVEGLPESFREPIRLFYWEGAGLAAAAGAG